jgi:FlaA1/EpsC-like NDP-sugar epimerase
MDIAEKSGCQNFVLISSDKAVNPTNVMGATKRVGELILACQKANSMRCVSVRFGNVLGSSGSVVPVLQRQLRNGEPLTITHPEIRRFFMTTREAVSLVLEAFAIGEHGDILVLDMGESVSILELARTLIRLSGKNEEQVDIRFTGLREGEKLYEELFSPAEEVSATSRPKIKRVRGKPMEWPLLVQHLSELRASLTVDGAAPVRAKLQEIIPEYSLEGNGQQANPDSPQSALYHQVAGRA